MPSIKMANLIESNFNDSKTMKLRCENTVVRENNPFNTILNWFYFLKKDKTD